MIETVLKFLIDLFGLGDFIKSQVERAQAEQVGAIREENVILKSQVDSYEKQISEMRDQKNFTDNIVRDPNDLERMRILLEPSNDTDKKT